MKKAYVGWIGIIVLAGLALLAARLAPTWRQTEEEQRIERQIAAAENNPPPLPGQGRVTENLPQALRLNLPVVAYFYRPDPDAESQLAYELEHPNEPRAARTRARVDAIKAEVAMLSKLAADYKGAASVVRIIPTRAPASVSRAKVKKLPTTIIYGADDRELWRHEGAVSGAQIRAELARLHIRPAGKAPPGSTGAVRGRTARRG